MNHSQFDLSGLSARNRRVFAFGVRGADGDDPNAELEALLARVDGIAELSDDDVTALLEELRAAGVEVFSNAGSDEDLALGDRIVAAITSVTEAQSARETEATRIADAAAAGLAAITGDGDEDDAAAGDAAAGDGAAGGGGDGDAAGAGGDGADGADGAAGDAAGGAGGDAAAGGDGAGDELSAEAQAEADRLAAAASRPPARVSRVAARRPASTRPRTRPATTDARMVLRASGSVAGQGGTLLDTPESIMHAFDTVHRATLGYHGPRTQIPVASLGVFDAAEIYGEERTLRSDARGNEQRIMAVTSESALRASGGICAPPPIQYDLPTIGTDARPVRDALARFGADRGGVRLLPPPQLADVTGAVGIWTEANDVLPADPTTKVCMELDCPAEVETLVDAITRCLTIGNFRARYFPEQVQAWVTKVGQWYARVAEVKMLTKIGALSTQITAGERILGTTRDVLRVLDRAAAATRSRQRLPQDFPLRMIGPMWLLNNMVSDLSAEEPGSTDERLVQNMALINSFFTSRNINVTWSLDGETGQIFGAQHDGTLVAWPSQVIVYLFVEGEWLFLDGGTLDFGLVRDSVLNATNDYQLFSEGFEQVAFHGAGETFRLKIDICASGATAAPVDTSDLCDDFS